MSECIESEISRCVAETFKNGNFKKVSTEITATSEKGEGYLGDINFVKITAATHLDEIKEFHVVIKSGKQEEAMKNLSPIRLAYQRENFFYDTAVLAFQKIEKEYGLNITEPLLPKCYNTVSYENQHLVVLQNLKTIGFDVHDRQQPFDLQHLKLTLSNYGKFHALSFAYREHRPKEFQELFGDLPGVMEIIIGVSRHSVDLSEKCVYKMLENNNEFEIVEKLKKMFPHGFTETILQILKSQSEEVNTVLSHGDCWNNNFMFKYRELDRKQPESVKFLDFQLSQLCSPALDIVYHIYTTSSEKELVHLKELINVYYSSLCNTLRKFGCNPDKVFPYSELVRQLKKYSSYAMALASFTLQFVLTDKEDTVDFAEIGGDNLTENTFNSSASTSRIFPRITAMIKHHLEFDDY